MPESVNTSPLFTASQSSITEEARPAMVKVDHVSMVFNMASEQLNSLKEYAIALARKELRFKEFRALNDVSFEIKKGDVYGILGTNGSGKSTLLKIIAGVLEPTEGTCAINGNIAPLIELGAGFDMELTARENIYLNGALLGYPKRFIQQHFDEIVEFAEIEKFLDMPLKNYSSGMVARIAFAIATVIVPDILIVDEVLSVGDFMFQQKCERRITTLIKEHDVTVLIVSHNNDQIERLCNKAIWIEKGHTRMMGTAQEVCTTYRVLGGRIGSAESEQRVFDMLRINTQVPKDTFDTVSGESRYSTAVKLSEDCEFASGETIIVAPGEFSSPCMIATSLSGMLDAPVLLTKPDGLPDVTRQAIKHHLPNKIIIVGNEQHISSETIQEITETCGKNVDIVQIAGPSISQLAIEAYRFGRVNELEWGDTAVITYDGCTGDLISMSPFLHIEKAPLFFNVSNGVIDEGTISALLSGGFDQIVVLGGQVSFPDACIKPLVDAGIKLVRFCGDGPYHTNELINDWLSNRVSSNNTITIERLIVSSVWNPFDAFAAGPYAGKTRSAFLLEDPQNLDSVAHALDYIENQKGKVKHLTFLGDTTRFSKLDKKMLAKAVVQAINTPTREPAHR